MLARRYAPVGRAFAGGLASLAPACPDLRMSSLVHLGSLWPGARVAQGGAVRGLVDAAGQAASAPGAVRSYVLQLKYR